MQFSKKLIKLYTQGGGEVSFKLKSDEIAHKMFPSYIVITKKVQLTWNILELR